MKKFLKISILFSSIIIFFFITIVVFLFFLMNYMESLYYDLKYYDRGIDIVPVYDYIVVPGAKIQQTLPGVYLEDRLEYAYQLYTEKQSSKIILSGGFDEEEGQYETTVMLNHLIKLGVSKEDILCDMKGNSTYETLKRVKDFVGDKKIIFCTQELYSSRALYIADHLNLNMIVYCSDSIIYADKFKSTIRESLAQVKAIINCNFIAPNTASLEDFSFIDMKEGF